MEPLQGGALKDSPTAKRHLVILVNGLFGSVENWDVVVECLKVSPSPLRYSNRQVDSSHSH